MSSPHWHTELGEGPLVACALHDGHEVRPEVADLLGLSARERRYEEDPHTGAWTAIAPTRIVVGRSRFEVDLNRPRELALYRTPAEAWGLEVWKSPPPPEFVERSLQEYDAFFAHLRHVIAQLVERYERIAVFDLHSYNHQREVVPTSRGGSQVERERGRAGEREKVGDGLSTPALPLSPSPLLESADRLSPPVVEDPEINLGTRTMDREFWAPLVDRWLTDMREVDFLGRRLDVRENVRFFGGFMAEWLHGQFPRQVCVLAIEVKKFFMDERTGEVDWTQHEAVGQALARAAAGVQEVLENWSVATRDD